MTRIFLAIVGLLYLYLAAICSFRPASSAKTVGFVLQPGSGDSEFLTLYGGLECALGLAFLWPLYRASDTPTVLAFCVLSHGCLVLFRSLGFLLYAGIAPATYYLAAGEWVIFLLAVVLMWRK